MNITIKQASIKNKLFLAYEYDEVVGNIKNNVKKGSDAAIHDDLRTAFNILVPHFAFICEEITEKQCRKRIQSPDDILEENDPILNYSVSGFSLGKHQEGVVISGAKTLKNGDVVNFNTPFVKFEDAKDYPFMSELMEAMDNLKSEVYEYLEGKQAPTLQMQVAFEEEEGAAI